MPRTNRHIESGKPYELCLRIREGLPFPCLLFIKLLLESAMARAMRGRPIIICHYLWMGNHLHMIAILKDATAAANFYGELQKRLTDYMKQVLGVKRLSLWEGRPMVAQLRGLDTIISRIRYLYANPARANLVDRIEDYPGLSSWKDFQRAASLDSSFTTYIPWIRLPAVTKVGARSVTTREDRKIAKALMSSTKRKEALIIAPNAWMSCFDVEEAKVAHINSDIFAAVRAAEKEARSTRERKGKKPLGAALLREARIMRPHTPKKKERKVFVISLDEEDRILFIERVKALLAECKRLFRERLFHLWPPGVFMPSIGMKASAVELT